MYFRTLHVYQTAISCIAKIERMLRSMPAGHAEARDQLRRASLSIALNIAEATGKTQVRDQRRFFAIARGSTMECAALVDVFRELGLATAAELARIDADLLRIVQMLSKLSLGSAKSATTTTTTTTTTNGGRD